MLEVSDPDRCSGTRLRLLLAAFVSQVGAIQTAPVLIAVVSAYLTMEGVKYVVASRKTARAARGASPPPA